MKIQIATDTIVDTFNPTDEGKVGAKIFKIPFDSKSSEIRMILSCKPLIGTDKIIDLCWKRLINIYEAYPPFLSDAR